MHLLVLRVLHRQKTLSYDEPFIPVMYQLEGTPGARNHGISSPNSAYESCCGSIKLVVGFLLRMTGASYGCAPGSALTSS